MSQFLGNMTTPNFLFDVARGLLFEAKSSSGTNEIAIFVEAVLVKTP